MREKIAIIKRVVDEAGVKTLVLMAATFALLIAYLFQVNHASTAGYTMRDIDKQIASLKLEHQRLNMQVARLQSVDSVATRIQMLGLRPIEDVRYVDAIDATVALR